MQFMGIGGTIEPSRKYNKMLSLRIESTSHEFPKFSDPWDLSQLKGLLHISYGPTGGMDTLRSIVVFFG